MKPYLMFLNVELNINIYIRLPTIWVMVKNVLEKQLGLLVMMNWAGRCQRFGQKELRALSGSILVDFFNFPHYWPITVHLTLLLLAVSP